MRSASGSGSALKATAWNSVTSVVVTPMPSASTRIIEALRIRVWPSERAA